MENLKKLVGTFYGYFVFWLITRKLPKILEPIRVGILGNYLAHKRKNI